jgi:RNA polymerase sigma-70 factor (ECF subfamily)
MNAPVLLHQPDDGDRAERELLARLRTGDARAFEELFRAYAAPLCDFAFSYVREREGAEEIVQDLFCRLWEQRHTLEMPFGARAYLWSSVRNRALNALRDERLEFSVHERLVRESADARAGDSPLEESAARDLADAVAQVIREMPVRCREVYTMVRVQHLAHAEVSRILGISPKTVEIHMTRALAILRARLAPWMQG